MGIEVWCCFDKIDPDRYLYHYTTIETLLKILHFNSLRFSNLCNTNDLFEQKPKVIFESRGPDDYERIEIIKNYLNNRRKRVKVLCFSQDSKYEPEQLKQIQHEIGTHLSKDKQRAHMFGRGFALPRMWAQYANNNHGVCIIFKKQELLRLSTEQNVLVAHNPVIYKNAFDSFVIDNRLIQALHTLIQSNKENALTQIIARNTMFVEYNYFSKVSDWAGENEYRLLSTSNSPDDIIEIRNVNSAISGIVLGSRASVEYQFLLFWMYSNLYDLRRICFDDEITRIEKILFEGEKENDYSKFKPV